MEKKRKRIKRIVILTGKSGAGKSTLQRELWGRGWNSPLNFTTREPRNDAERNEYVFLSEKRYDYLLKEGVFLENTGSYGNRYAISANLSEGDVVVILDPAGREQVVKALALNKEARVEHYFLEVEEEILKHRLKDRPDKEERMRIDNLVYTPSTASIILDGTVGVEALAEIIINGESNSV